MASPNRHLLVLGLGLCGAVLPACGGESNPDSTNGMAGTSSGGAQSTASGAAGKGNSAGAPASGPGAAGKGNTSGAASSGSGKAATGNSGKSGTGVTVPNPLTNPDSGPAAGDPSKKCAVPSEAGLADVSKPTQVVGTGTAASCTESAFIGAVEKGGIITFNCGSQPTTITLSRTAKIFNDSTDDIVIDGGGLVTLSGGGKNRILYMNTCDEAQHWTTSHCDNQETPRLTLQNLTFIDGNAKAETEYDGGGAVWVRGGRFKVINSRFFNNVCADTGPDLGGGALRVLDQYNRLPVYVVNSTFGGADGYGNACSNGGGISSIGVSWTLINSVFTHNRAVGNGGNPADSGTPGGGSGGAIYNDGNTMTLSLCGTRIENNIVNAYGAAIFFVSNNHTGTLNIDQSTIQHNSGGSWHELPGISMHADTAQNITNSTLSE